MKTINEARINYKRDFNTVVYLRNYDVLNRLKNSTEDDYWEAEWKCLLTAIRYLYETKYHDILKIANDCYEQDCIEGIPMFDWMLGAHSGMSFGHGHVIILRNGGLSSLFLRSNTLNENIRLTRVTEVLQKCCKPYSDEIIAVMHKCISIHGKKHGYEYRGDRFQYGVDVIEFKQFAEAKAKIKQLKNFKNREDAKKTFARYDAR